MSIFSSFFQEKNPQSMLGIDIGSNSIKITELERSGGNFQVKNIGLVKTPEGSIVHYNIVKPDEVANAIRKTLESLNITQRKAVVGLPGPVCFTKRIKLSGISPKEIARVISSEAGNHVPYNLDSVCLDFQLIGIDEKQNLDVLLVAVKKEIIDSYVSTLKKAQVEPVICDVDYFALGNIFEASYPEERLSTIALLDIGETHCAISILKNGAPLLNVDVGVGSQVYKDDLCSNLKISPEGAEEVVLGKKTGNEQQKNISDSIEASTKKIARELSRKLSFFASTALTETSIEGIYLCGGGVLVDGLVNALKEETGLACKCFDPARSMVLPSNFHSNQEKTKNIMPMFSISLGLATRRCGDKPNP